ncbi:MAG: hypothetical protein WBV39_14475 [Rudaea sp.]
MIARGNDAFRNAVARGIVALALAGNGALNAQAVDLVAHNGFEACWSQAQSRAQFLGLMQSSLEGQTSCIGMNTATVAGTTFTACNTAACPGGQVGCPVTVHVDPFDGDFATGTFAASGSANDVDVPVNVTSPVSFDCTVTLTAITLTFAPDYVMVADGNNGVYAAQLTQAPVALDGLTISSDDPACEAFATSYSSSITTPAEAAATAAVETRLRATTVGASICPLTP